MKEAIGNSFLVSLTIILCTVIMLLLVASFAYSKAFKIRNNIINNIERYEEFNSSVVNDLSIDMAKMGYRLNTNYGTCPVHDDAKLVYGNTPGSYHYCVYEHTIAKGTYYEVITYMHFDVPIVGDLVAIPVKGESRIFYNNVD